MEVRCLYKKLKGTFFYNSETPDAQKYRGYMFIDEGNETYFSERRFQGLIVTVRYLQTKETKHTLARQDFKASSSQLDVYRRRKRNIY